jgi:hypothetical protein
MHSARRQESVVDDACVRRRGEAWLLALWPVSIFGAVLGGAGAFVGGVLTLVMYMTGLLVFRVSITDNTVSIDYLPFWRKRVVYSAKEVSYRQRMKVITLKLPRGSLVRRRIVIYRPGDEQL